MLRELNVCWNDAFRRVSGFKRYQSVKELQPTVVKCLFHIFTTLPDGTL